MKATQRIRERWKVNKRMFVKWKKDAKYFSLNLCKWEKTKAAKKTLECHSQILKFLQGLLRREYIDQTDDLQAERQAVTLLCRSPTYWWGPTKGTAGLLLPQTRNVIFSPRRWLELKFILHMFWLPLNIRNIVQHMRRWKLSTLTFFCHTSV